MRFNKDEREWLAGNAPMPYQLSESARQSAKRGAMRMKKPKRETKVYPPVEQVVIDFIASEVKEGIRPSFIHRRLVDKGYDLDIKHVRVMVDTERKRYHRRLMKGES